MSLAKTKTSIKVHTQFEGVHCYPKAPELVKDLRDLHRHIFHVRVQVNVTHDDREIEFFLLKHDIERVLRKEYKFENGAFHLGACSCEMIAKAVYSGLDELLVDETSKYGLEKRDVIISVSEDDNNEAILEVPASI